MKKRTREEIARDYYLASGRANSAPTQATLARIDAENIPRVLDTITDVVLAHRPKPKSRASKKRKRKEQKLATA